MESSNLWCGRPECTWEYIDRLQMAHAATCKERDEAKQQLQNVINQLHEVESERDAAVRCIEEVRRAMVLDKPTGVLEKLLEEYLRKAVQ